MLKLILKKISVNEARELYHDLIKLDVDALEKTSNRCKNSRNNILAILDNIKSSLFDNFYFHYQDKSPETEESIAKRTVIRRQRLLKM